MDFVRAVRDSRPLIVAGLGHTLSLTDGETEVALRDETIHSTDLDLFPGARRLTLLRGGAAVARVHVLDNPEA